MATQVQESEGQRRGRKRLTWVRWILVIIAILFIAAGTTVGITQGSFSNTLSIILNALGVLFTLFQWLLPVSSGTSEQSIAAHPPPQIIVHVPTTQPLSLPTPDKTAYRGILGMPPPTDPKTIQQREKVVNEVYTKLTQPDITAIVLTGIGGVGKSTIAALVYRYAEEQRHAGLFDDEPIWLTINDSVTMADLAGSLFEALGKPLPDFSSLSSHSQALALFNALNTIEKARLIVLDQFENLLDWDTGRALRDRPGVGEWIDAINSQKCTCRLLLTSRPWPQGTREYPPTHMQEYYIKGLEVIEGIELLKKRGIEATEAELCTAVERCEGHAYALTFLASLLRSHNLSLSVLFKDATYAQLWTGDIAHNLLDYIYTKQLSEVQRKLLLAFSVYRESVPWDAAQALIDFSVEMPKTQVLPALKALRTQHLLQASGEGRYLLHAIVAGYAQNHFVEDDEQANQEALQAAHGRAAQYYMQWAATTCPAREQRRRSSDVQPLIEAVWQHCQAEQWQEAYKLMKQEGLFTDLKRWGGNAILLELYQLLLPSDKWHPEGPQEAYIYNNLGRIYSSLAQKEQALRYLERALDIRREVGDREGEATTLNYMGRVYDDMGQKEQARKYLEQALDICREVGDHKNEGNTLNNLGRVYSALGKNERARMYFEQALSIRRDVADRKGEGTTLSNLGLIYANLGQKEQARSYYEEALSIHREVGNSVGEGATLRILGMIYADFGKKEALIYIEQALSILRGVGDRWEESRALNNLGQAYSNLGQKERAQGYLEQALDICRGAGDRREEGRTLSNLGRVCSDLGQKELAQDYLMQALSINREVGDRGKEGKTIENLGEVYDSLGQKRRAWQYYEQAIRIYREVGDHWGEGEALHNIGKLYFQQHRNDIALASFLFARRVFEEVQSPYYRDETLHYIDRLREELGEEEYSVLLAEVEPQAHQIVEQALREGLG